MTFCFIFPRQHALTFHTKFLYVIICMKCHSPISKKNYVKLSSVKILRNMISVKCPLKYMLCENNTGALVIISAKHIFYRNYRTYPYIRTLKLYYRACIIIRKVGEELLQNHRWCQRTKKLQGYGSELN